MLWVNNVLLFGVWYWQLDGGGPAARTLKRKPHPDFLFPQMTDDARQFVAARLGADPARLPVHVVHQRDRVQPDRHDAADTDGEEP